MKVDTSALGCGYDVVKGPYADPQSVKMPLLVVDDQIHCCDIDSNQFHIASGETLEEHQRQLGIQAGLKGRYGLFTGEVKGSFTEASSRRSQNRFVTVTGRIALKGYKISPQLPLADEFKARLANVSDSQSALEIFNDFGTHVLCAITVGGHASYKCVTSRTEYTGSYSFSDAAKFSYQSFTGGVAGGLNSEQQAAAKEFHSSAETTVETVGGDVKYGNENLWKNYSAWSDSVNDHPVFCDFAPAGLVPISEFCTPTATGLIRSNADMLKELMEQTYETYKETASFRPPPALPLHTGDEIGLLWPAGGKYLATRFIRGTEKDPIYDLVADGADSKDSNTQFTVERVSEDDGSVIRLKGANGGYLAYRGLGGIPNSGWTGYTILGDGNHDEQWSQWRVHVEQDSTSATPKIRLESKPGSNHFFSRFYGGGREYFVAAEADICDPVLQVTGITA